MSLIVGISGCACSGKSDMAKLINGAFKNSKVFRQADYYYPEGSSKHKDPNDPGAFDVDRLVKDVREERSAMIKKDQKSPPGAVKNFKFDYCDGKLVAEKPGGGYELTCSELTDKLKKISWHIIIIEGITLFNSPVINRMCTLKFFFTLKYINGLNRHIRKSRRSEEAHSTEPPGYFERVIWPAYRKNMDAMEKDETAKEVRYLCGENCMEDNTKVILTYMIKYLADLSNDNKAPASKAKKYTHIEFIFLVKILLSCFKNQHFQETGLPPNDRLHMKKYLYDHGLDVQAFDSLVRGQFPKRPFIPLKGQTIKGHIKLVKEDDPTVGADRIVIEADVGEILYVEAPREYVYVFGHWMGKADLKYILENEEVYFEFHPLFDKNFSGDGVLEMPRASLVWILDEESRPRYIGQGNRPEVTERMDNMLWKFVRAKNLDVGTFRALVEGRLPPKSVGGAAPLPTTPAAQPADLDSDVLEQAKLLQQMKQSLGQSAMMQAMMLFMSSQNNTSQQNAGQMMEMMKRFMGTSAAAPSNNTPPLNIATSQEQAMSSGSAVLPSASGPMGYTAPTRSHLNQSNTTASFAPKSTQDILQSVDDLLKRSRNPRQPDTRDPNLPLMQQFSKDPYWDWYESDKK